MAAASDLVREAFRTEERGVNWRSGLAGAVVVIVPLAIGLAADEPVAGFTAAIGGLNTALAVPRAGLRARLWWGVLAALGGAAALAASTAGEGGDAAVILVSVAWVAAWAFFRAAGSTGALLGFATSAVFVIFAGLPADDPLGERLGVVRARGGRRPGADGGRPPSMAAGDPGRPRRAADGARRRCCTTAPCGRTSCASPSRSAPAPWCTA